MSRLLVSGGAGFIGSHVTEALLRAGHRVLVLDNLATGAVTNLPAGADLAVADITDVTTTARTVAQFAPAVVIHLAAQTLVSVSSADPIRDATVNVLGTLSLLQASARGGSRKLVFASSSTVYGEAARQPVTETDPLRPISPYGASKLAGEHYIRVICGQTGMRYTILRLANVFGPRDSPHNHHVITSFVDAALSGEPPVIEWDGEQTKDYVFVADVAAAVVAALELGDDAVFNVGSGTGVSVNELLRLVRAVAGTLVSPLHRPRRAGDVRRFIMDASAAQRVLRWSPDTPLLSGIHATVEHARALRAAVMPYAAPAVP